MQCKDPEKEKNIKKEYLKTKRRKKYCRRLKTHYHWLWARNSVKSHRRRGYIVNISVQELTKMALHTIHCPMCGCPLKWHPGKFQSNSPTLDRKENTTTIDKNNSWIICRRCNSTKLDRSFNDFLTYCIMILRKFEYQAE